MALTSPRFNRDPELVKAADNNPPIRQGANGACVRIIQMALIDLGFPMPNSTAGGKRLPDGIFGMETLTVVRSFQRRFGLEVDGIVGRQTLGALERECIVQSALVSAAQSAQARQTQMRG
jgi:peptidoglycan hydrolase-like protein with peptidoglycan-binding domain